MEVTQNKAFEIIGQQQMELVVLRERLRLLADHQCAPCGREHSDDPQTQQGEEKDERV